MASESTSLSVEPVTVVFSTDDGYAPYLLVAISSVLRHSTLGRPYEIVVLDKGVSEYWRSRLLDVAATHENALLRFLPVDYLDDTLDSIFERRGNKGKVTKWSYSTYYRLFLASLLPNCRRAVYLDVDTLVCGDIAQLYDMDLSGRSIAAAIDVCLCFDQDCEDVRRTLAGCGHDMERYFNAGILVIDLDRWRAMPDFEEAVAEKLRALPHLVYPDQDILNVLFSNDCAQLDVRWNFLIPQIGADLSAETAARREMLVASRDFGIIHYAGVKPWRFPEMVPLAFLWWECARHAGVDGDIMLHETALLRSHLKAKQEAERLNSLRLQAIWLQCRLLLASSRAKNRLKDKRERVCAKLKAARAGRKRKL